MKLRLLPALAMLIAYSASTTAQTLIDVTRPTNMMSVGVRAGLTSSNIGGNFWDEGPTNIAWHNQNWRNGYAVGAVVDLNILGCFSLEPGAFIYSRSNDYSYFLNDGTTLEAVTGKLKCNYLQVPIMASFRMGVAELIQAQFDFGPYFAWGWGGKNRMTVYTPGIDDMGVSTVDKYKGKTAYFGDSGLAKRYDYGLKMGVGIVALSHVYVGCHYMLGLRNVLNYVPGSTPALSGHNKAWVFTLGYNL